MKYLRILFILTLVQSCTIIGSGAFPSGLSANYFLRDNFPKNDKAIIVISIAAGGSNLWYRIDDQFNGKEGKHGVWLASEMNQVRMLEPGIYSLGLFYTAQSYGYSSYIKPKGSVWENDKPALASFEVKSGEVLYIGDLHLSGRRTTNGPFDKSANTSMRLQNNYEKAKKHIKDKYPELYDRLSVRLIKLGGTNE